MKFSPCSRPRMVFWIAASWSLANLLSRTTPNSKMWFSIFWDTPTPLGLDEISWFSSNFASKTRISDLKSQILSEKNIFFFFTKRSEMVPSFQNVQKIENRTKTPTSRANLRFPGKLIGGRESGLWKRSKISNRRYSVGVSKILKMTFSPNNP